ncbi:uncharacterized protein LOC143215584 isoform X2 [Lasioglossum baleicum]|uniref:uncharacterized protein LOC143215584 isoform X2 n=1 Tax=Lasioglossum baleicum TaxID=434251 RepID=UPI003FCC5785
MNSSSQFLLFNTSANIIHFYCILYHLPTSSWYIKNDKVPPYFKEDCRKLSRRYLNNVIYTERNPRKIIIHASCNKSSALIMFLKLIVFSLFLAGPVFGSNRHRRNDSLVFPTDVRKNSNSLLLVNPEQVRTLEETIQRFLAAIAQPIKGPIILRSTENNNLQMSIREMCDSARNRLMQFADDCNLTVTVQRYSNSLRKLPVSKDWFSEAMLQIAFFLRDVGDMINETGDKIEKYFGVHGAASPKNQQLMKQSEDLEFLGVIYNAADFGERLSRCLLRMPKLKRHESSTDLDHVFFNITKNPPQIALKTLKSSLQSTPINDFSQNRARNVWHSYLCRSLAKQQGVVLRDCVRDLQNLEKCIRNLKTESVDRPRSIKESKWFRSIEQLSDCEVRVDEDGKQRIACKFDRKMPKTVHQKMKYTFEKILNRRISKRSSFHRAVDDLSDTLSQKPWGQRLANEFCQFCMIYDNGLKKLRRSSQLAARDSRAAAKHRKVLKAFQVYRDGAYERMFGAIGGLHRSTTEFQKFLVKGVQNVMNEAWQSNVKIMSCMMDWMNKVLDFYSDSDSSSGQQPSDASKTEGKLDGSEDWDSDYFDSGERKIRKTVPGRSAASRKAEASMNDLIESMNRVSRVRSTNDTSMLAGLTDNLLLVTMFIETLGFVSTLYCFEQGMKNETLSLNFEDRRRLTRRSLLPLDDKRPFDSIPEDYAPFALHENLTIVVYH